MSNEQHKSSCLRVSGKFPLGVTGPLGSANLIYHSHGPLKVSDGGAATQHAQIETMAREILRRDIVIRWQAPQENGEALGIVENIPKNEFL